ncbi:MAG: hypothetical protein H0W39_06835 [Sphingomonas sp.]|nr:hypothetical protein [Sphingomonas sp.]
MHFGAVGDGTTNDRAAVLAAMAAAFDNGLPLDGSDALYGVSDDIVATGKTRPYVRQLRLKNIAPSNDSQVLYFLNCEQVRIDSVYIHTGDAVDVGDRESRSGLRIEGGSGHRIRNVEATGQGKGMYVFLWRCSDWVAENIWVHDGLFSDSSRHSGDSRILVEDDVVEGIRINDCSNWTLENPVVHDLLGNATYYTASGFVPGDYSASEVKPFPNMRTRGISGGGNDGGSIINPRITNVDQGIDFSGSGGQWGNKVLNIFGGHTLNCASVGLKYGGQPQDVKVVGHTAENCGMFGFLIGGSTGLYKAHNCALYDCTALNPGYNDIHTDAGDVGPNYIQNAHTGFLVFAPVDAGIEGVTLDGCRAIDRQGFNFAGDDMYDPANPGAPTTWPGPGATSGTLQFPWTGYSGHYQATLYVDEGSTGQGTATAVSRTVTLTSGSTKVSWSGKLPARVTRPFVSRPAQMQYGYMAHNEAGTALAFNQNTRRPLTLNDNCESVGHIVARQFGFHRDVCHIGATGTQPINARAAARVTWTREVEDTMEMHSLTADNERIRPKRPGVYRVRGVVNFASDATGFRQLIIRKAGDAVAKRVFSAVDGEMTSCPFDLDVEFTQGDVAADGYIDITAYQTSGGALNINEDRWMKIERLRAL